MANKYKVIDEKTGIGQCTVLFSETVLNRRFV